MTDKLDDDAERFIDRIRLLTGMSKQEVLEMMAAEDESDDERSMSLLTMNTQEAA